MGQVDHVEGRSGEGRQLAMAMAHNVEGVKEIECRWLPVAVREHDG
jgi:hypothetical protein